MTIWNPSLKSCWDDEKSLRSHRLDLQCSNARHLIWGQKFNCWWLIMNLPTSIRILSKHHHLALVTLWCQMAFKSIFISALFLTHLAVPSQLLQALGLDAITNLQHIQVVSWNICTYRYQMKHMHIFHVFVICLSKWQTLRRHNNNRKKSWHYQQSLLSNRSSWKKGGQEGNQRLRISNYIWLDTVPQFSLEKLLYRDNQTIWLTEVEAGDHDKGLG